MVPGKVDRYKKNLKLFIVLFLSLFSLSIQGCGFEEHRLNNLTIFQEEKKDLRFLQTQQFEPIRIFYDFTTLDNQTGITNEMKANMKDILNTAKSVFESLLKVRRLITKAKFGDCDTLISISQNVSNVGVDADLVIFPFFDTVVKGNTEAYASACVISGRNNRPVAGLMAFTMNFNTTKDNWKEYYTNLAIHEMTHVFVFNPDMFGNFVDENEKEIPVDKILKTVEGTNGEVRRFIITPRVVEVAKRYFNCSNLTGVELENQGGQGTVTSHWEARVMLSDYMIGISYDEMSISEITLAFFEDSGWYKVNYYTGGLFRFGKHSGCDFLQKKCVSSNGVIEFQNEFCSEAYAPTCTASKSSRGICYITQYDKDIDSSYRYFSASRTGGLSLADFCPVTAVVTNKTSYFPWSCTSGFPQYPKELEEKVSDTSACFVSSLVNNNYLKRVDDSYLDIKSICYSYNCDLENRNLIVVIGSKSVKCPREGGYVTLEGYTGKLQCPDFNQVCTSAVRCSNLIDCALKKVLPLDPFYDYVKNSTSVLLGNTTTTTNTTSDELYSRPFAGSTMIQINYILIMVFILLVLSL